MEKEYLGKWRIIEMDNWDRDCIDLVVPGHITIKKRNGDMEFGALNCDLDCQVEEFAGIERMEFSFLGMVEGAEISGRGWAMLDDTLLRGHIFFHHGDHSGCIAKKQK